MNIDKFPQKNFDEQKKQYLLFCERITKLRRQNTPFLLLHFSLEYSDLQLRIITSRLQFIYYIDEKINGKKQKLLSFNRNEVNRK